MEYKEFLLEIGTEEIPADFNEKILMSLKEGLKHSFEEFKLDVTALKVASTPRRLVVYSEQVALKQEDVVKEVTGPPAAKAYDGEGNPTGATLGFARAQGVEVSELSRIKKEKGEFLGYHKKIEGRPAMSILPDIILKALGTVVLPKSMRWGAGEYIFIRPVHWLLALFDGLEVPFHFLGITSGKVTRGHRFMSNQALAVSSIEQYFSILREHNVLSDISERRRLILSGLDSVEKELGGRIIRDEALLQTVLHLVEFPVVLSGTFPREFLEVPKEVIVCAMKSHQKYFPVVDPAGELTAHFAFVANTRVKDSQVVIKGNERVLKARLSDARFFYRQDLETPLAARVDKLAAIVFQKELGTVWDKVIRMKRLLEPVCQLLKISDPAVLRDVTKACHLCKADLVTEMVKEFPELQGVMGQIYSQSAHEEKAVSQAIFEHYLPRYQGDALPETLTGNILSMVDKIITLAGYFGLGLIPSASADPFALRRQAVGLIRVILNGAYHLSLKELIDKAFLTYAFPKEISKAQKELLEFIILRLKNMLYENFRTDLVESVIAASDEDLLSVFQKVQALQELTLLDYFEPLMVGFKRVVNIIKNQAQAEFQEGRLVEASEKALYQGYLEIKDRYLERLGCHQFKEALSEMVQLKPAIDLFFDQVMVMCDDAALASNRMGLLQLIRALFTKFADFSLIQVK